MSGGRGNAPPPMEGGNYILQLMRKPPQHRPTHSQPPAPSTALSRTLHNDPAVAEVGPTIPFSSSTIFPPSNGYDHTVYHHQHHAPPPQWPHHQSSPPPPLPFAPHIFFSQNPNPGFSSSPPLPPQGFNQPQQRNIQMNLTPHGDDIQNLGVFGVNPNPRSAHLNGQNLIFGSLHSENLNFGTSLKEGMPQLGQIEGLYGKDRDLGSRNGRGYDSLSGLIASEQERSSNRGGRSGWGNQGQGGSYKEVVRPPGFMSSSRSGVNNEYDNRRNFEQSVNKGKSNLVELNHRNGNDMDGSTRQYSHRNSKMNDGIWDARGVIGKLNNPGPGSNLVSVSPSDVKEPLMKSNGEDRESGSDFADLEERLLGSLGLDDLSIEKNDKGKRHARDKDYRSDKRGKWLLAQRVRIAKRRIECRLDIDTMNAPFLGIYESLIPAEEEKAKQNQLLTLLEKHVSKEWPDARLYVYGSCANSFGFSKSDLDVCLAITDIDINKSEVLLKLADILQADNLEDVQALTRARVPIVKLKDPVTGISCDICINNMLAVINTKLLRDYAKIDGRLRQLAFIVKHWAKSRGVNETYQGTLSSYAYVLMCIHFLQQRKPAILPCLQDMEPTCSLIADNVECAYFDQVEKLHGFGSQNGECIAKLVWAFFNYWAYCHDYTSDVISVRAGNKLSKRAKDWTRRIGNDRHLICIEDPFETSHDLGRVVDKNSIRVLREEFERAAEIMQCDRNPCVKLFEPYVPS